MYVLKYPIAKVSIFFVAGILFAVYFPLSRFLVLTISAVALLIFLLSYFLSKGKAYSSYFALAFFSISFSLGMLTQKAHDYRQNPKHFLNNSQISDKSNELQVVLLQRLKPTAYAERYIARIQEINGVAHKGKLLVNLNKEISNYNLSVGSVFKISTDI